MSVKPSVLRHCCLGNRKGIKSSAHFWGVSLTPKKWLLVKQKSKPVPAAVAVNVHCLCADERALVLGAKQLGFVFHTRLPDRITITVVCIMLSAVGCTTNVEFAAE